MTDINSKRSSFKTVGRKDLLAINSNESVVFGSKMSQTKYKPLGTRGFLRFFARNCGVHLEHIQKNKFKE